MASSAGGITALGRVLGALPAGLRVPLVIVQHLDPRHSTVIADVLSRRSNMPVKLAAPAWSPSPDTRTSRRPTITSWSARGHARPVQQ